jgi:hypothetical protein
MRVNIQLFIAFQITCTTIGLGPCHTIALGLLPNWYNSVVSVVIDKNSCHIELQECENEEFKDGMTLILVRKQNYI